MKREFDEKAAERERIQHDTILAEYEKQNISGENINWISVGIWRGLGFDRELIERLEAEKARLTKLLAKEFNENDELGAEYTHVRILKDQIQSLESQNTELKKRVEELEEVLAKHRLYAEYESEIQSLEAKLKIAVKAFSNAKAEAMKSGLIENHRCEHIVSILNEATAKLSEPGVKDE